MSPERHCTGQNFMHGVCPVRRNSETQDSCGQGFSAIGASGGSSSSVKTEAKYM